jgi:hypothetical protein
MTPLRPRLHALPIFLALACNDRNTSDDDESVPERPLDLAAPESESEGEVICREDLLACNGECVDPSTNDDHCGACDHECREPVFFGACQLASCPSAHWCASVDLGLETCSEVCAHHGQTCDEGPRVLSRGCGGAYLFTFGLGALERCEKGIGSEAAVDATCDDLIDWSYKGGLTHEPARAVACCCTQEPPQ